MTARTDHFMPVGLLDSQLATLEPLEPDENALVVQIGPPPTELAGEIIEQLRLSDRRRLSRPVGRAGSADRRDDRPGLVPYIGCDGGYALANIPRLSLQHPPANPRNGVAWCSPPRPPIPPGWSATRPCPATPLDTTAKHRATEHESPATGADDHLVEASADDFGTARTLDVDHDWFKRAVFYEVLVRAFADSNRDGTGDLRGLTEKLDYLQWLGVDCLWLPPFYDSPLRDGGYDIRDFRAVLPEFGTVDDFVVLLDEAHKRGIRVITDLVMNHTSDTHAWFQESRRDPQGPYGDFYVWSDDNSRYPDARIIFVDTETSNWTYDPVRGQFYWHRFFSHQPDLNYDNPDVQEAMIDVLRFWLDLGIDGFRLDAVPYLFEREDTNCENLAETHEFLKRCRKVMDVEYPGRVLLAEANQWPADVVEYFGDPGSAATSATWRSTSRSCRGSSWRCAGRAGSRSRRSWPRPRPSRPAASGASSCATTTS